MFAVSTVNPPVKTALFLKLASFLKENGSDRDPVAAIEDAIEYWMDNASWKKTDLMPEVVIGDSEHGYTWKSTFLPSGTIVRIKYEGSYVYAKVEGDYLIYSGERVSPNQFATKVTGTARDAWRDLWIKRPSDPDFRPASDLRDPSTVAQRRSIAPPDLTIEDLGL
jgi:hypothetical protein